MSDLHIVLSALVGAVGAFALVGLGYLGYMLYQRRQENQINWDGFAAVIRKQNSQRRQDTLERDINRVLETIELDTLILAESMLCSIVANLQKEVRNDSA